MKILLTGASGLLGGHILKQGLEAGHGFKTISRSISKRSYLFEVKDQVENFDLDLTSEKYPQNLFDGVDIVINAAALASAKKEDEELMTKINVDASKRLFEKSCESSISQWIQLSSVSTLGRGKQEEIIDETNHGEFRPTHYAKTKYEFDLFLKDQDPKFSITTIYPCYMLGAFDSRPSSGAILFALKLKKLKHLYSGQKNFVAASDVARAIYLAMDKKVSGDFVIGAENVALSNFIAECLSQLQMDEFKVDFKQKNEDISMLPDYEQEMMKEFSLSSAVSIDKASESLKYVPQVKLREMIKETLDYFEQKKMLRIKRVKKC